MSESTSPEPGSIREAREAAGLTQAEAAALVHALERSWRHWEGGAHKMPAGLWELFLIKVAARGAQA